MTGSQMFALAGIVTAAGLVLLIAATVRLAPSLGAVLAQLSADPRTATQEAASSGDRWSWLPLPIVQLVERHLGVPDADLRLIGWTRGGLAARKIAVALAGVLLPPFLTALLASRGVTLPWSIPAIASILLAAWLWTVPSVDARSDAAKERERFRSALAAFLDLVALERLARGSVAEALAAAASISDAGPFVAIRDALHRASLSGRTPWAALKELGEELDVEELRNLADIAAVASDGGAVYKTLLAESRSLRHATLSAELTEANKRSERMSLLNTMLVAGLALFVMSALIFRLYTTT